MVRFFKLLYLNILQLMITRSNKGPHLEIYKPNFNSLFSVTFRIFSVFFLVLLVIYIFGLTYIFFIGYTFDDFVCFNSSQFDIIISKFSFLFYNTFNQIINYFSPGFQFNQTINFSDNFILSSSVWHPSYYPLGLKGENNVFGQIFKIFLTQDYNLVNVSDNNLYSVKSSFFFNGEIHNFSYFITVLDNFFINDNFILKEKNSLNSLFFNLTSNELVYLINYTINDLIENSFLGQFMDQIIFFLINFFIISFFSLFFYHLFGGLLHLFPLKKNFTDSYYIIRVFICLTLIGLLIYSTYYCIFFAYIQLENPIVLNSVYTEIFM